MRVERRCARNCSASNTKCRNGCNPAGTSCGISIVGVNRDPDPRRAHEAETLGALLRHHNPLPAADQIRVEETTSRDEPWMLDRRIADALQAG